MTALQRWTLSFGITDEIFAVASQQKGAVNARYFSGLILMPYIGWALGTLLGATVTELLPPILRSALGIAIYGMFLPLLSRRPVRRGGPVGGVVFHGIELRFQMDTVPLRDFFRLGNYYLRGGSLCLGGDALPGGRCAGRKRKGARRRELP